MVSAVSVLVRNNLNCLNRLTVSLSLFRLSLEIMWNIQVLWLPLATRVYFYIPVWRECFPSCKVLSKSWVYFYIPASREEVEQVWGYPYLWVYFYIPMMVGVFSVCVGGMCCSCVHGYTFIYPWEWGAVWMWLKRVTLYVCGYTFIYPCGCLHCV